jgi:hypothetical protein
VNATPELRGYELDQRLLEHPLAEIWRGRASTGMEVIVLVLSERGAADGHVRDRLSRTSRAAALAPDQQQTPLWAANLTADRPYAVTQLVPGQSGAERLLDPLDGLLGNDEESLNAVRSQLAQYGALPIPTAEVGGGRGPHETGEGQPEPVGSQAEPREAAVVGPAVGSMAVGEVASGGDRRSEGWARVVAVVVVLVVFCGLYSVGSRIRAGEQRRPAPATAPLVSPKPLPSPALRPGSPKPQPVR